MHCRDGNRIRACHLQFPSESHFSWQDHNAKWKSQGRLQGWWEQCGAFLWGAQQEGGVHSPYSCGKKSSTCGAMREAGAGRRAQGKAALLTPQPYSPQRSQSLVQIKAPPKKKKTLAPKQNCSQVLQANPEALVIMAGLPALTLGTRKLHEKITKKTEGANLKEVCSWKRGQMSPALIYRWCYCNHIYAQICTLLTAQLPCLFVFPNHRQCYPNSLRESNCLHLHSINLFP